MIMILLIIVILSIIVLYTIIQYNSLVKTNNLVKEAFSTMDVYLKKRWDLIPNLVEVVKGYANYEKDTLNEITTLRTNIYDNMSINKKIDINEQITQNISKIMAISENYPELRASENFLKLSKELTEIEDEIANSRKYYNGTVRMLNNKIQMFPSNIVANIFKFKQEKMFEANTEEKNNIKVNL
jgi:LemA protein